MFSAANPKDRDKPAKRPVGRPKGSKNGPNAGKGGRPVGRPKKGTDSQCTTGGQQGECFFVAGSLPANRVVPSFSGCDDANKAPTRHPQTPTGQGENAKSTLSATSHSHGITRKALSQTHFQGFGRGFALACNMQPIQNCRTFRTNRPAIKKPPPPLPRSSGALQWLMQYQTICNCLQVVALWN
jgi:hypothetical protein